jgi:hypothetical protein
MEKELPKVIIEKRRHRMYVTRNTEYHLKDDICVAVRKTTTVHDDPVPRNRRQPPLTQRRRPGHRDDEGQVDRAAPEEGAEVLPESRLISFLSKGA